MEKNELLKYLTCPLTKLIFCDPVIAEDGRFYEYMAIKNHISKSNISPVSGEKIGNLLVRSHSIKEMVDKFLDKNTEYKSDQFLFKKPFYLFIKEFYDILKEKQFDKLREFTAIILNTEYGKETLFEIVCKNCPEDIIKHIIDNSIDYDVSDKRKTKPIHMACKYSSPDIIMHMTKKGVDLESEDSNGDRPLHFISSNINNQKYKKDTYTSFVKDFLNHGINVNATNKSGHMAIHHIINSGDIELLKEFLNHNLNINVVNQKLCGLNLLQYSFRYSFSHDLIKFMIDLNSCLDIDVDPKTSCEQLIYQNEHLNKKQKQQLVLHYLMKVLSKAEIIDNYMDNIKDK